MSYTFWQFGFKNFKDKFGTLTFKNKKRSLISTRNSVISEKDNTID